MGLPARVRVAVILAVLVRPMLWWPALRQCARLAPLGWWRRWPFLPLPDSGVVEFRLMTAYGSQGTPKAQDLIGYLRWCADRR
jgi:hypothetical protein